MAHMPNKIDSKPLPIKHSGSFHNYNGGHAPSCPAVPLPRANSCKRPATQSCNTTPRHLANGRLAGAGYHGGYDHEAVGEKHWGEILERTVSSMSLQNMQRIYRNDSISHPELRLNSASNWHI
ncbi:hypothetical protein SK128_024669 [Halocaridina rubra]|uniref:Uncharacterized protein n=1 Tax=Halocaridina rubra TaxID=373956 RepID=A0AAN9A411_HALRR